jgi:hypothetical protein
MARAIVHGVALLTAYLCVAACGSMGAPGDRTQSLQPATPEQPSATEQPTRALDPTHALLPTTTEPPASPGCGPTGEVVLLAAFRMCGDYNWESALLPIIEATNKDKNNFCSAYESTPQNGFAPPWELVINIVANADPKARARVASLIPDGAPVEWRVVKYSWSDLMSVIKGDQMQQFEQSGEVVSEALDTENDRVVVTTHGEQPDLAVQIEQAFGDKVTVISTDHPPVAL